ARGSGPRPSAGDGRMNTWGRSLCYGVGKPFNRGRFVSDMEPGATPLPCVCLRLSGSTPSSSRPTSSPDPEGDPAHQLPLQLPGADSDPAGARDRAPDEAGGPPPPSLGPPVPAGSAGA